jgi:hypothetical protein
LKFVHFYKFIKIIEKNYYADEEFDITPFDPAIPSCSNVPDNCASPEIEKFKIEEYHDEAEATEKTDDFNYWPADHLAFLNDNELLSEVEEPNISEAPKVNKHYKYVKKADRKLLKKKYPKRKTGEKDEPYDPTEDEKIIRQKPRQKRKQKPVVKSSGVKNKKIYSKLSNVSQLSPILLDSDPQFTSCFEIKCHICDNKFKKFKDVQSHFIQSHPGVKIQF